MNCATIIKLEQLVGDRWSMAKRCKLASTCLCPRANAGVAQEKEGIPRSVGHERVLCTKPCMAPVIWVTVRMEDPRNEHSCGSIPWIRSETRLTTVERPPVQQEIWITPCLLGPAPHTSGTPRPQIPHLRGTSRVGRRVVPVQGACHASNRPNPVATRGSHAQVRVEQVLAVSTVNTWRVTQPHSMGHSTLQARFRHTTRTG